MRGTAAQLHEKYLALARDAYSSGDRVAAENCFQHADHYHRILSAQTAPQDNQQQSSDRAQQNTGSDAGDGNDDDGQAFNGREQRRQPNGGLKDGDPRSRPQRAGDQQPLDEGLHRMLGDPPPASAGADGETPDAAAGPVDLGAEKPAQDAAPAGAGQDSAPDGEPAAPPRRRRRRAAPDAKDDDSSAPTEAAE